MATFAIFRINHAVPDPTTFETLVLLELIHKSSRRRWEIQDERMAGFATPDWMTEWRLC